MAKQADLLSVDEAQRRILECFVRLESESVDLDMAQGRVLATVVHAPLNVPPFANSSMDGFALVSGDTVAASDQAPVTLKVVEHIAAGSSKQAPVRSLYCSRIMTGAPLPPGADAVIPFEEVKDSGSEIIVPHPVPVGASVRPTGNDMKQGEAVLPAGQEIGPSQIALLASLGIARCNVIRRPSVAVLSTGDELVDAGTTLLPGQIYNSNSPMLKAAIHDAGGMPYILNTSSDDPQSIADAIDAAQEADLLLTTGGASVGDYDYIKDVVGSTGDLNFWRVRVRPGKPLLFGKVGTLPVIGLPGNPTSAMVTFEVFARPAIRTMAGATPFRPEITAVLDDPIENHGGRRTYARVQLTYGDDERWHASLSGKQDSAMLLPLAHAHGLLVVPEEREQLFAGEHATVQVWNLPGRKVS